MGSIERCCGSLAAVVFVVVSMLPALAAEAPFERTEQRAQCASYEPLRQPLFGETHLHTAYSFDAATLDTRNTPADAYRYAKGDPVGLPPWIDTRDQFAPDPPPPATAPLVAQFPYCLPPERCEFTASRIAQLPEGRALDWAAITDHAEQLGENNICLFDPVFACGSDSECPTGQECGTTLAAGFCIPKGYTSPTCILARDELTRLTAGSVGAIVGVPENGNENPSRVEFCDATFFGDGLRCVQQAGTVWEQIQNDAEAAYDRSAACSFTSFIAYEYTAMMLAGRCETSPDLPCWDQLDTGLPSVDCPATTPGSDLCVGTYPGSAGFNNMHRNIIFRNDDVLDLPISNLEAPVGCGTGSGCDRPAPYPIGSPQQMLEDLRARCKDRPADHPRCDVLSIPHNPNVSGGAMFLMPESIEEAEIRNEMEPLVEIMQIKGASECRFLGAMPGAWGATDEQCGFENYNYSRLTGSWIAPENRTPENIPPNSFVRNTLKNGIAYDAQNGVNPFKLGFVGGLDNHNGTPGHSEEIDYARHGAHGTQSFATSSQALNEKYFLGFETNGGGLTVAWAEENSRDSIFAALARREDLRDQRYAARGALLRRSERAVRHLQPRRLRGARLRERGADGRHARRQQHGTTLRGQRAHGSRLAEPPRHQARPGADRQGLGRRERHRAGAGVRPAGERRRTDADRAGRWSHAAGLRAGRRRRPAHLPAEWRRPREPVRRLAGPAVRPRAARVLLRARPRAAELPLEPVLLQRARRRLQRADGPLRLDRSRVQRSRLLGKRGVRRRRVRDADQLHQVGVPAVLLRPRAVDRAAARVDLADLVPAVRHRKRLVSAATARGLARRAVASPLVHFAVVGLALVAVVAVLEREPAANEIATRAERAPIVLTAERAAALERVFTERWGRAPSAPERTALLEEAVHEEMLYREARVLALGLDDASVRLRLLELMRQLGERPARDEDTLVAEAVALGLDDDVVIRRLLAQKMRLVLQRDQVGVAAGDDALAAVLERERARFVQPEAITVQQVFLSSDVRGDAAARDAEHLLAELHAGTLDVQSAAAHSDALPLAGALTAQPRLKLQARFGKAFADAVFALEAGAWSGPIASPFGLHLVRVVEKQPERLPALDEVRPALIESLRRERAQANLARGLARLRGLYEVRIETETATTPASGERLAATSR